MNREQLLMELAAAVNNARIGDDTGVASATVVQIPNMRDGERTKLMVCGVDMAGTIEFFPKGTRGGWQSNQRKTGKMRMNIGQYGEKVQFHERRDGTLDMEKAARLLVTLARKRILDGEAYARRLANQRLAELITTEEVPHSIGKQIVLEATDEEGMLTAKLRVGTLSNEAGIRRIVRVWVDLIQHGGV